MIFLENSLDKTSAKNINVHLTAKEYQRSLIVGLSRFAQAMIRLNIIYNFRAVRDTETSQGSLRHAQVWFDFNTLKHC